MKLQILTTKVVSNHTFLAVISLYFAWKKDKNYCSQVYLKECKDIREVVLRHITEDIKFFLATQMKNSFFINGRLKKFQKHDKVLLFKL